MSKVRIALRCALYRVRERENREKMSRELMTMDMTVRVSDGHDPTCSDVRLCDVVSMSIYYCYCYNPLKVTQKINK